MCRYICHVGSWRGVRRTGPFTVFGIGGVESEGCNGYCK